MTEIVESGYKMESVDNWQDLAEKETCKNVHDSCNDTGWIVAVSVLSAILIIIIVTIVILYFKVFRPKFDLVLETKPPPSTFEKNKRTTLSDLEEKKNENKILRRATGFPKDYDPKKLEEELEKEIDEEDEAFEETDSAEIREDFEKNDDKEKRKGVVFNEEVEEIHITVM